MMMTTNLRSRRMGKESSIFALINIGVLTILPFLNHIVLKLINLKEYAKQNKTDDIFVSTAGWLFLEETINIENNHKQL